ncbi:MAG: hypothetical protein M0C28_46290 [Candidatus Moduliflexus flocculans]|nr:hypothetical protein [Candidatus Moduliflexus flocculans]
MLTVRQFGDDPDKARPRFPDFLKDAFRDLAEKKTAEPGHRPARERRRPGRIRQAPLRPCHGPAVPLLLRASRRRRTDYDLFRYTDETAEGSGRAGQPAPQERPRLVRRPGPSQPRPPAPAEAAFRRAGGHPHRRRQLLGDGGDDLRLPLLQEGRVLRGGMRLGLLRQHLGFHGHGDPPRDAASRSASRSSSTRWPSTAIPRTAASSRTSP